MQKATTEGDTPNPNELYRKLELLSSADEKGKLWEVRSNGEPLREADMVELAEWVARELGWIRRS